jgi:HSP20 family molecular chaperone IbpA
VDKGILTIHAERHEEVQAKQRTEFRYGLLQRSVRLPANAVEDGVVATYTNGILTVTVPLTTAEPTGRQVPVAKAA